ncbi:variable surface lipoprotein [Mycoplasmopsis agalactiae]|uniref:variable surface lipoprotein n=1 Tax=Mycoplasmopsis agalactiae TaxID=2110 RepID=UPI002F937155
MKKSKFLLLGSLFSLAAIPFVAAKCGGTKEEGNKNPADTQGGGQTNSTPSTSTTVDLSKLDQTIQAQLNKLAKDGVKKKKVLVILKTVEGLKDIKAEDLSTVEFKDKKLVIAAKEGSKLVSGKYEFSAQSNSDTLMELNKIDLNKLEKSVKQELNKLAKKDVLSEDVLDVLKKVQGLESLRLGDIKTVEFKDNKLIIEANKDLKLVSGKYEFVAQTDSTPSTSTTVDLSKLDQTIQAQLNKLAKDGVKKKKFLSFLKTVEGLKDIKAEDLSTVEFKDKKLVIAAKEGSKLVSGKYEFSAQSNSDTLMELNKIDLNKLEESVKQELNKLAKKDVLSEDVLDVLKKVQGLESLRLGDLSKVEFNEKDKKLTIESHKDSKLVTGKYEFTLEK